MATYRDWLGELTPLWAKGRNAANLIGTAIGLLADELSEGFSSAVRAPWMTRSDQPDDALDNLGLERSMPRYRSETADTYRGRLLKAWDSWAFGGVESGIVAQYNAFGLPNVDIQPLNPGHLTEWSRVRVIISTPHPYTASPRWGSVSWGAFNWGLSPEDSDALIGIIRKWKAGHERVMEIVIVDENVPLWGVVVWGAFTWGGSPPPIVLQVN